MAPLSESRFSRLLTLGALYFAQGVPWGFIAVGYVVFLTDQGLGNEAIGAAIGLAYLPWSFKIFAGPFLDRFAGGRHGRRRPFIIGAQLMMGLSLLGLLFVGPTQLWWMGAILFAHNSFAALQDVATDALAVDVLRSDERGKANSIMWAAKNAGVAVGGGGGTVLAKYAGWSTLFIVNALLIWVVMILVLAVRERPPGAEAAQGPPARLDWPQIKKSFGFATPILGVLVAMCAPVGYAMVGAVYTRLLRADLALSEERIAILSGTLDPISGVLGALFGGFLADRVGPRKAMGGAMFVVAASLLFFAANRTLWPSFAFLVGYTIVLNGAIAAFNAAALGFYMTLSNPAIGATQFTLYMAAVNFTYAWSSPLGGRLADRMGVPTAFAIAGVCQLVAIALLPLVDPKRAEIRYRAEPPEAATT